MTNRKKNNECKKYGLAITDYVLGEDMDISRDELFNHLRTCEKCRRDIFDWQDTYAVMRTEAHFAKPETKKKYAELLEKIKNLPAAPSVSADRQADRPVGQVKPIRGEVILDPEEHIGHFAGVIWHHLARNGRVKEGELKRKVKLPVKTFDRAIGWLAGEKKIHQTRVKRTNYVYLTPLEREKYQAQV